MFSWEPFCMKPWGLHCLVCLVMLWQSDTHPNKPLNIAARKQCCKPARSPWCKHFLQKFRISHSTWSRICAQTRKSSCCCKPQPGFVRKLLLALLGIAVVEHWNTADEAHFGIAALQLSCMMVEKGLDRFAQLGLHGQVCLILRQPAWKS